MKKERIKIIITFFIVIILVFIWLGVIKAIKKSKMEKAAKSIISISQQTATDIIADKTITTKKIKSQDSDLEWVRCPFSGRKYGQESILELEISGIIWDEVEPHVIINGEILREGDSIGDFVVKRIEKQRVILSDGMKEIELNI